MSSINRYDSRGLPISCSCGVTMSSSRCARKRFANTTANGVPIAVPLICRKSRSPYSIKLLVSTQCMSAQMKSICIRGSPLCVR